MKLSFDRAGCRRGIYVIKNTVNGHFYVGQTVNIVMRFHAHHSEMRRGHSNGHLRNAVNKYGAAAFEMSMLRPMPTGDLDIAEQFEIIRAWDAGKSCYNINPSAAKPPNMRGIPKSKEANRKRSASLRLSISFPVLQLDTDGVVVAAFGSIAEATERTGIRHSGISACCSGKSATAGGFVWRRRGSDLPLPEPQGKTWDIVLISPSGERYPIKRNLAASAERLGIPKGSVYALVAGRVQQYKGWRVDGREWARKPLPRLRAPDGSIIEVGTNRRAFCRDRKLGYSGICAVIAGRIKRAYGWTVAA